MLISAIFHPCRAWSLKRLPFLSTKQNMKLTEIYLTKVLKVTVTCGKHELETYWVIKFLFFEKVTMLLLFTVFVQNVWNEFEFLIGSNIGKYLRKIDCNKWNKNVVFYWLYIFKCSDIFMLTIQSCKFSKCLFPKLWEKKNFE